MMIQIIINCTSVENGVIVYYAVYVYGLALALITSMIKHNIILQSWASIPIKNSILFIIMYTNMQIVETMITTIKINSPIQGNDRYFNGRSKGNHFCSEISPNKRSNTNQRQLLWNSVRKTPSAFDKQIDLIWRTRTRNYPGNDESTDRRILAHAHTGARYK